MPFLHMYVPTHYPLIQHLFKGNQELWVYLRSTEREGLVRYSMEGKEIGFYTLEKAIDISKSRIKIYKGNMYFMVTQRKLLKMYLAPVPKN